MVIIVAIINKKRFNNIVKNHENGNYEGEEVQYSYKSIKPFLGLGVTASIDYEPITNLSTHLFNLTLTLCEYKLYFPERKIKFQNTFLKNVHPMEKLQEKDTETSN